MFRLSLSTFRERWPLFIGAVLTVCLGVALVQSSLLILVSAASPDIPAGLPPEVADHLRDGYTGAITLLAMTLGLSAFLAIFIVSSTFAFTVAQRRRDLALRGSSAARSGRCGGCCCPRRWCSGWPAPGSGCRSGWPRCGSSPGC
ncbi:hypothetical protein [Amycolatopsis minnesotensis]|uniref:ABC transmembrane type-1 domain-containing protein n=1 Tax=Amycolatopsis minnesotensis TaxID=337894 RepID=A0ABN2QE93_9PSEU